MKLTIRPYECEKCLRRNHFPKYACKTCARSFSSNFLLDNQFNWKYQRRKEKQEKLQTSDERLRTLYSRIREKYFDANYLRNPDEVIFTWKRGKWSTGGWCRKSTKEIRIGGHYKFCFIKGTDSEQNSKKYLVMLLIHEAMHLRIDNHRKYFKEKVREIQDKVKDSDMDILYEGLIKEAT